MNSKEYTLPNGKKAVFEYDVCGIGKITLECMDELMAMIADRPQGEWIAVSAFDAFGGDESTWLAHGNPTAFHYCSECREQTRMDEFGEEILSNFCPNCGARMTERSEDK